MAAAEEITEKKNHNAWSFYDYTKSNTTRCGRTQRIVLHISLTVDTKERVGHGFVAGETRKIFDDENMHLLVCEVDGKVVSSVQLAIIESLTHDVRPFGVIENVVTHGDFRCKGYASALLQKAIEIAKEKGCYKVSLETGSNRESTLNFYRNNGFVIDEKHSCLKRL